MLRAAAMPTAFVTGGSGFLGRNLIGYLRERGWLVRGLARSEAAAEAVRAAWGEPAMGDVSGGPGVVEAMRGCDVLFHSAALADDWADERVAWEANVVGTERMIAAAREAGVPRVVHVSTEAVLVGGGPIVQADETRPRAKKPIGVYPKTKGAAEERAIAACAPGLDVVVVRPRFIWGKGDTNLLPKLIEATRSGALKWIAGGRYLTSTCHVRNVCEGMVKAAEKGRAGEIYFLTDGEPIAFREMIERLLRSAGVEPPMASVPRWVVHAAAIVLDATWRTVPLRGRPPVTHTGFHLIGEEVTVRDDKARSELGYLGEVTRDEGFAEMERDQGFLGAGGAASA